MASSTSQTIPPALLTERVQQSLFHPPTTVSVPPQMDTGISYPSNNNSQTLSLGALVPEKTTKNAIWNNEFVELTILLNKRFVSDEITVKFFIWRAKYSCDNT